MKLDAKNQSSEVAKPSKLAEKTRKVINGYNDIQHFCQEKLKYTRLLEKEQNHSFEPGYN